MAVAMTTRRPSALSRAMALSAPGRILRAIVRLAKLLTKGIKSSGWIDRPSSRAWLISLSLPRSMIFSDIGQHRQCDDRREQQPPRRALKRAMDQERGVGRAARDGAVHVVDGEVGHQARPGEDRFDQGMVGGLVDIDRGERIAHFNRAQVKPEAAAERRHRLVERAQPEQPEQSRRAERGEQSPALLAILLDPAPQLDRLGGSRRPESEQIGAAVAPAAKADPGALGTRQPRQQRRAPRPARWRRRRLRAAS